MNLASDNSCDNDAAMLSVGPSAAAGCAAVGPGELLPLVYAQLRAMAVGSLARHGPRATLRPTELVHEVWLRVSRDTARVFQDQRHFIANAAVAMRQIIIDWARRKHAAKRSGRHAHVEFEDQILSLGIDPIEALTIDEALSALALEDPRAAKVVECRFFLGLSDTEIADTLGITDRTVRRDWTYARMWLSRRLSGAFGHDS